MNIKGTIQPRKSIVGVVDKAATYYIRELEFKNHFEFPNIGDSQQLYIAIDENAVYRFDSELGIYQCVSRDCNEIGIIQCKLKEE
jgi:hypothetical protein